MRNSGLLVLSWLVALAQVGCGGAAKTGVRVSMAELHASGGVPVGWKITPPTGDEERGKALFTKSGCNACHLVREPGAAPSEEVSQVGPELTGMGGHHPPGYFLESIINPNAVLVDGEGYISPEGQSIMPAYPDLKVTELADLVAYLSSLTSGSHDGEVFVDQTASRPKPAGNVANAFYMQSFEVRANDLPAFENWFADIGKPRFMAFDGILAIETFVDSTRKGPAVVTTWSFRDQESLQKFLNDPRFEELGNQFDTFIGSHDHVSMTAPPIYKVPTLSTP
jgi:hypothetical protein